MVGAGSGVWGTEVPQWGSWANPDRRSGWRTPPEAEAKCEIIVQFISVLLWNI